MRAGARAKELVNQILTFSRQSHNENSLCSYNRSSRKLSR